LPTIGNNLKDFQKTLKTGTAASFILLNGLVVAAIAFVMLHFAMADLKDYEARTMTRDIKNATEQSLADTEKSVRALQAFYTSVNISDTNQAAVMQRVQQLLSGDARFSAVLWTTDKGVWHQIDIEKLAEHAAYDPSLGWPSFQQVDKQSPRLELNQVGYQQDLPWPAFAVQGQAPLDVPVGLIVKTRLPDSTIGILFIATTPGRIFGNAWSTQREDLASVVIKDHDTGSVLVNSQFKPANGATGDWTAPATVNYVLQMGDQSWDVAFGVRPTLISKLLSASPYGAFALIAIMTGLFSIAAQRKHRQDVKIAEMSKHLEGAQSELQNKISERDKLFHALRKSERENRAVINSVSDVIFETDETGRLQFLNETWKRITHREVADTLQQSLFSLIDPADQVKQRDMFEELVRGERQAYRIETRLNLGQNVYKPVEVAFSMLRMTDDKSIRVVGTITDIEKRRRAEMAVREAEHKFRAMFENSISGIYQGAPDGRFLNVNAALAEIFGYESAEDIQLHVTDVGKQIYVRPEEHKEFIQRLLFEGRVAGIETEVYRKDGSKIWIMQNARVVRSEKGSVDYYEGSIYDVPERRRAEEVMRQARVQAEISSRTRMEFLANMSHELRTPLNAVIGFSEIIKDEVMGPLTVPVYKEYAQDIYDSGNYLLKIISEILEVSKIETGNRDLNVSNFRIQKALKSCMTIMTTRVEQAGVDLTINLADDLPDLLAEELGFKQIMLNLIGNAIKFTPKGGKVSVTAQVQDSGEMYIDITDTGIGMNEAEIKKAMQPFGKVDTTFSGMKEGTGLGLTIVDSLVRLHGGSFKLISQKGVGTTARVIMPASRVLRPDKPAAEPPAGNDQPDPAAAPAGEPHLKIVK
jgi:PAS domain S-box-containing protein